MVPERRYSLYNLQGEVYYCNKDSSLFFVQPVFSSRDLPHLRGSHPLLGCSQLWPTQRLRQRVKDRESALSQTSEGSPGASHWVLDPLSCVQCHTLRLLCLSWELSDSSTAHGNFLFLANKRALTRPVKPLVG